MSRLSSYARTSCSAGFLVLLACILSIGCRQSKNPASPGPDAERVFHRITVQQADSLIQANRGNADFVILDVRTASEYAAGHLENALSMNYNASDFREQLSSLDKTRTYMVYCGAGSRSAGAASMMQEMDFLKIYEMQGGISAWINADYPVVR